MRRGATASLLVGLLVGLGGAAAADAGTILVYQDDTSPAEGAVPQAMKISFQGDRLRVDFGVEAMLFVGTETATVLDLTDRTYSAVHLETVANPADQPKATYQRVGEQVAVGDYLTSHYQVLAEGRLVIDLWVADPAALHIDPADTVLFAWLRKRLAAVPISSEVQYLAGEDAPVGVPIKIDLYRHGGAKAQGLVLQRVSQSTLPPSTFEVPIGFTVAGSVNGARPKKEPTPAPLVSVPPRPPGAVDRKR
jgi:hypothetical protein